MENYIRKLRGELTQTELAKLSGVAQANIARFEKGKNPKIEIIEKIARAVGKELKITITDIEKSD